VDTLIEQIPKTLEHAIVTEEGVPMECVTNLQEVVDEVTSKFVSLKVVGKLKFINPKKYKRKFT